MTPDQTLLDRLKDQPIVTPKRVAKGAALDRAAQICLFFLLLVVPFEPRFTLPLGPFHLSLVEAVALPCFAVLSARALSQGFRGQRSASLVALALMFAVSLVSAGLAATGGALKFALRLGAMTTFAHLVSRCSERQLKWGFRALVASGGCAAVLALLEGLGVPSIDVLLGAFREIPYNVAGVRRATAGSEYPNLGAGMILYALLAGAALGPSSLLARAGFVLLLTSGLAFTYSRGAWVAGLVGLLMLSWFERGRARFVPAALYALSLTLFVGGEEISQVRLGGENANDFYAATYKSPRQMAMDSNARVVVPVTVRNVGRRPWRKTDQIHLSYHLYENAGRPLVDGPRTDLSRDVMPGESITLEAVLRAPLKEGEYLLMWDLVHEDVTWFSGQGVRPGVARLIVGNTAAAVPAISEAQGLKAVPEPLAWRPSRLELWRIALRMWGANPFFGVGPDNFRRTYGTVAGKSAFDSRVYANNVFLELASTLGTFGLAAFCVAVAFSLASGWRAALLSPTSRAALAILVAMMVHGLVDYLFAFTGHYLVFGFVVGTLARDLSSQRPQ